MIDLAAILNTDALSTFRDALESHVYWQLSDLQYRNNGYVHAPASDDPVKVSEIVACCEIAREIDNVLNDQDGSWLPGLLDDIEGNDNGYASASVALSVPCKHENAEHLFPGEAWALTDGRVMPDALVGGYDDRP